MARINRAAYDAIAERYAVRTGGGSTGLHDFFDEMRDGFAALLPGRARVLDVGCGPGHVAAGFARAGLDAVGVDPSAGMLAVAARRGVRAVRADMTALPFADACTDGLWCQAALLHVPAALTGQVLHGFGRVLRPGGLLGLVTSVGHGPQLEPVDYADGVRRWFIHRDPAEVLGAVTAAGFTVTSVERRTSRRDWIAVAATH